MKPTKSDIELDNYFRQLYLYSVGIKKIYGMYPISLEFNLFRKNELIKEQFQEYKLVLTKNWALQRIKEITLNEEWSPSIDYFKCRYLCDVAHECVYFDLFQEGGR